MELDQVRQILTKLRDQAAEEAKGRPFSDSGHHWHGGLASGYTQALRTLELLDSDEESGCTCATRDGFFPVHANFCPRFRTPSQLTEDGEFSDAAIGGLGSGPRYPIDPACDCCKRQVPEDQQDGGICDDCYPNCSANYCAITKESGWNR